MVVLLNLILYRKISQTIACWRSRSCLAGIALVGSLVGTSGCAALPDSQRLATSFGEHSYVVAGSGVPTIVMEAGLGDGKESWREIFADLVKVTRSFAYDRAGYGASQKREGPRTGAQIVEELRALLQAARLPPPYILVGHSLGGTYMELYARTYAREVAGVVLIDSRHVDFSERCDEAGALVCEPPAFLTWLVPGAGHQEFVGAAETMRQVRAAGSFPHVPLVVITGMNKILEGATFNRVWLNTQKQLADLSPLGRHVVCERCGHYPQRDNPALVVMSIQNVVAQVRAEKIGNHPAVP